MKKISNEYRSKYVLMTYYVKYLKEVRNVSNSTVDHYQQALQYISKFLVDRGKIKQSIYEIQNIDDLEILKEYVYLDPDFIELDTRGHRMYSAGLNNYIRFANGKGFGNLHNHMQIMDVEIPVADKHIVVKNTWRRSSIIKMQSIESAGYRCEINQKHETFTAKNTGKPYMEGHHALPMKLQDKFINSLDVYANVICLCPTCHRLLHYGVESEKKNVIDKIYYDRADRLAVCGIKIGKKEFESLIK